MKKKPQERADALFLVIDTDTLVKNKDQYNLYLATKEKYKKQGVIFIESHLCIELWFLYHLADRFARTNYETYEALRPAVEKALPGYDKTAKYYQKNQFFRENILLDTAKRAQAIDYAIRSCKYTPVANEIANYSEIFKAIHFFRLLQKFVEIRTILTERLRRPVYLSHEIEEHKQLHIYWEEKEAKRHCCTLKYKGTRLFCLFADGVAFELNDREPLAHASEIISRIEQIFI